MCLRPHQLHAAFHLCLADDTNVFFGLQSPVACFISCCNDYYGNFLMKQVFHHGLVWLAANVLTACCKSAKLVISCMYSCSLHSSCCSGHKYSRCELAALSKTLRLNVPCALHAHTLACIELAYLRPNDAAKSSTLHLQLNPKKNPTQQKP